VIDSPQTRRAFRDLLAGVYAYYRKDFSDFVLKLWWNGCEPYELEDVQAILSAHIQDPDRGGFLPMINDITRALHGTAGDRASLAWGKVRQAMSDVGQYADVVFDDPAIHCAVADLGGWPKLCRVEPKDLGYEQHRFTQAYRAYTKALPSDYPRRLMGDRSSDEEFARRGLPAPTPRAAGDRRRCRIVYEGRATTMNALLAAPAPQLEHQP
jgi:hypothetical protein